MLMFLAGLTQYREAILQYRQDFTPQNETHSDDDDDEPEDEKSMPLHARPVIPEVDSETETEEEDMPPLISASKPSLRVEIPPIDVAALLAREEAAEAKKED